jgi:hypothetical protein
VDLNRVIKEINDKPLSHQVISSFLKEYENPNDKIHQLTKQEILIPLRKGLYVFNGELIDKIPSPILLANHIYGPSYVSLDFALQFYGAIPERVFGVTSVTPKRSRDFLNKLGAFSYTHIPMSYYQLGVANVSLPNGLYGLMALPEKALIDKLVTASGVSVRSVNSARDLLFKDWRISEEWALSLNMGLVQGWLGKVPKRASVENIIKAVVA